MRSLFLSLLFLTQISFAQGPCHDDVQKLCSGIEKGEGRIVKCLKEKEAEVSAACKEHREKMKGAMKDAHAACEDDVATLCSGVEKGKGRVMKCLKENKEKVSESCKASFAGMKNLRKGK